MLANRHIGPAFLLLTAFLAAFALLGAGPSQGERPPQPFFQDFISGAVSVNGKTAPAGVLVVACIDDCVEVFESAPKVLDDLGRFDLLEINPADESLIGHTVYFYLVNDYGRIRANETRQFVGVFDIYPLDLTFDDPVPQPPPATAVPQPTPTASLPVAGDPSVTQIPRFAMIAGAFAVVVGGGLLFAFRKQKA